MAQTTELKIGDRAVSLSNLEKVLYPDVGFTKADIIDYYIRIAPVLLPHLKDRPITLKRYPDGVEGFFFYERQCPAHRPRWVKTAAVKSGRKEGETRYCVMSDLPSLVWAANLADIEMHTFMHTKKNPQRPTMVVFDLDPGPPADIALCCQVAFWVKDFLGQHGLECFPKTSGSKGLQLYVPLNTPHTYEDTKQFAHRLAEVLEQQHPESVVSKMLKRLRKGKVLVDWSQNDDHKTTVCVYSLRAKDRPTVSTPVEWDEVRNALRKNDPARLVFDSKAVLKRVEKLGDLFAPVLSTKQKLPKNIG